MNLRRYKKKKHRKLKSFFVGLFWGLLLIGIAYYIFSFYQKIEIKEEKYTSEKLAVSTPYGQTVEKEQENSKKISDVIEETTNDLFFCSLRSRWSCSVACGCGGCWRTMAQ